MSQNVTLNGYNLQDSTVFTSRINHESLGIDQSRVKIPHRDGEKFVSSTYGVRSITLEGMLVSTTSSGLDGKIDDLKRNVIGAQSVNLDLEYVGRTRRFIVNVKNVAITRDYYHTTTAPYSIQCEAVNPPFGQDTTTISGIATSLTVSGTGYVTSVTISGTASPKPLIRFRVATENGLTDIEFKNTTTGTALRISPTDQFTANDVVEIDTNLLTVKKNGIASSYTGTFPVFQVGTNSILINAFGSIAVDVQQLQNTQSQGFSGSTSLAQTWQPTTTTTYNQIDLLLGQDAGGVSPGDVTVNVYSDNSGAPGTLIGSATIPAASISGSSSYVTATFTTPLSLTALNTYWIVLSTPGSGKGYSYDWSWVNSDAYASGAAYITYNGIAWFALGGDFAFKVYRTTSATWSIGYGLEYTRWWL